ncbi:dihydropteroate synthase [Komagataeibacter sp. FXV2]|nr:dihydropteroate synthase [Komagataeibacter sp. FXV2]
MTDDDRLLEPLGLLSGQAAADAVRLGMARWLCGGPVAFSLARLWRGYRDTGLVPVGAIPPGWEDVLARVCAPLGAAGLPDGARVMGIVNATPDSFSDGGRHLAADRALVTAADMLAQGATVIDIGGESTRPGAARVTPGQEWERIAPVIAALRNDARTRGAVISIDTRHASVMERALAAGADAINDVSALMHDPAAVAVVARAGCPVMLMHMRGTPETMNDHATYADVAVDVVRELRDRVDHAVAAGVARDRIMVDPGIGFAKTAAQNMELLARLPLLANLGCRVVLGVSRKRFVGQVTGIADAALRDPGSMAASLPGLVFANTILRVHDVGVMMQGLKIWQGLDCARQVR